MGVLRIHNGLRRQLQGTDKAGLKLRQEMQGAAQESHMTADRLAAGQTTDGLIDDSLEDGYGQVLLGGTLIDQGLDIRFGKNAAAGRDLVDGLIVSGILIQACRICFKKAGHLVNKRTCTAGTDSVHTLFHIAVLEIDDFGILAAELNRHIRLRREMAERCGNRDDLLNKRNIDIFGNGHAAGAGDHGMQLDIPKLIVSFADQVQKRFADVGEMPLII